MSETPTLNGDEKTVVENVLRIVDEKLREDSEKNLFKRFKDNDDVLSRWSDGLLYLGTVIKVDEENKKCLVKFEDNSEHWAMFKDLQKGACQDSDIVCSLCESGESEPPNEIVICDNCGFGFHQFCHNPEIPHDVLVPDVTWLCRQCAIIKSIKNGNYLNKSPIGMAVQNLRSFPYDMVSLSWDSHHKTNVQQYYCYCGGPGEWYMKMLQCVRCKQWFHEACIQGLKKPMLFGDRFYVFVCSVCNYGREYVRRLDMKWHDVTHLLLYNLTVKHNKKYFDFETALMPFVEQNWDLLQLEGCAQLSKVTSKERKTNILTALQNHKSKFKCGREIKKKTTIWGLRVRMPPPPPKFNIPLHGVITDAVFNRYKMKRGRGKAANGVKKKRRGETDLLLVEEASSSRRAANKKESAPAQAVTKEIPKRKKTANVVASQLTTVKRKYTKRKNVKSAAVMNNGAWGKKGKRKSYVEDLVNNNKANRMSCKHDYKGSSTSSVRCQVTNRYDNISSDDDTSSHGTLDSIIPPPLNFEGNNHPFRNLDLFPVSLSSLGRPSKRKLSEADIRITKNGQIKKRRHRMTDGSSLLNGYTKRFSEPLSEASADTGSEFDIGSSDNMSLDAMQAANISFHDLKSSVHSYFGAANRIASGERFRVLARRITLQGKVQYLIEWEA